MMKKDAKIYVAGHRGMVGSAIVRELERQGYTNIITRTHKELDLTRQEAVEAFFAQEKPAYVFLAAAKVGGIVANQNALADFMYDNMVLEMNVIHAAWQNGCKKLEFLGSSCIYPRMAPQPMKESCLLTSELEKTNEAYALAKISGLKYCEFLNRQYGTDYISVMPTNLYGPNDNYHPTHSHVLPALIRRFHEAKISGAESVTCWGDGSPLREFLYVDDLANLCVFLMNNYSGSETVNAGTGKELTINQPQDAIKNGIAMLTEDRRATGILGVLSIADNVSIASLNKYLIGGIMLDDNKIEKLVQDNVAKLSIKTPSSKTQIQSLSGGNQQKVLIARWLANDPDVFIMDEPTRGIDVGAKYEIYCIIAEMAKQGKSIIMISSEMSELIGMSDRIMVMCDGRCTGFIDGDKANQENIMTLATQFE